jgi:SAM-dependent methyltransferase
MGLLLTPMQEASEWIRRWAHLVPPGGRVLDVACGGGRHMRWFAARGHAVTGVDRDAEKLRALQPHGDTVCADIENGLWPFAGRGFEAVVVTNYLWRPLFPALLGALEAGGVLLYETFAQGNETVGRPARAEFLLRPGELLQACAGLSIVAYEDGFARTPDRFVQRIAAVRRNLAQPLPRHLLENAGRPPANQ